MAEAEDVIVDAARHATAFVQDLWRRHRTGATAAPLDVPHLLHRLDLLVTGVYGASLQLRLAQAPSPVPFVRRVFRRHERPMAQMAVPATDGQSIWLPLPRLHSQRPIRLQDLRTITLQQAARALRGSSRCLHAAEDPLQRALYEVLEASAADADLARELRGLADPLREFRLAWLARRPPLSSFPAARKPLEQWVRDIMRNWAGETAPSPMVSMRRAHELAVHVLRESRAHVSVAGILFRDEWTGELRTPPCTTQKAVHDDDESARRTARPVRSARLARRPRVREPDPRDESKSAGAWMIQTAQPHEHAEDPFGMQRPIDRDDNTAAEEFAESVAELAQARLVSTPGTPPEVLLSDDPPQARTTRAGRAPAQDAEALQYPEWDWRTRSYRDPGASVHLLTAPPGPQHWVDATLDEHRIMLGQIRRQFESLRARRTRFHRQADGDEPDLEACIEAHADMRAGAVLTSGLYQMSRNARRELAVLLLIDVSGSTDGWISSMRRVIDVEREALLLVCLALQSLSEPFSVLAFSGEGLSGVTVSSVKSFTESYGPEVALRIAGLEPQRYTRAGAAIRHASSQLMSLAAQHRLLLILSDGKPNDVDEYEGRYGVEDVRQAVVEARLQGIFPFCLTIDRQTATYLPDVFGEHQYAVLHRAELLPAALLGWLRRLVNV